MSKVSKRPFITKTHWIWLLSIVIFLFAFDSVIKPVLVFVHVSEQIIGPIPHFVLTLLAVVVGAFIDRSFLFRDLDEVISKELLEAQLSIVEEVRDELIPMSSRFGLNSIHDGLDINSLISSLDKFDYIDIMFTYHPDFDRYLPNLVKRITEDGIRARLLFGDPSSEIVQRRFSYITETSGGFLWQHDMIAKLKLFIDDSIKTTIENTRDFKRGELLEVKTYKRLPDIPIIVVRSGNEQGALAIKYVYQGFYLKRPAVELPFIMWKDKSNDDLSYNSLAILLMNYFEARWANAEDLPFVDRQIAYPDYDVEHSK